MSYWNNDKSSPEELRKDIDKLQRLVFIIYSKLPQEEKQAIFDELSRSTNRDDLDMSMLINSYRI
ncbi:hypothetical protein PSG00_13775 [Proteus mirabilis]|uniref:hypothetical protein n=1 Tax=Proteus mirabilis TaxID=584 RepID=UPI001B9B3FBD|nr:hypothetical protein [Proteus mirabilis]MDC9732601.1 hypothetical protein [Proteus mirabilis]HBC5915861.1 hypothetical protein [Proteus mirabilis]